MFHKCLMIPLCGYSWVEKDTHQKQTTTKKIETKNNRELSRNHKATIKCDNINYLHSGPTFNFSFHLLVDLFLMKSEKTENNIMWKVFIET